MKQSTGMCRLLLGVILLLPWATFSTPAAPQEMKPNISSSEGQAPTSASSTSTSARAAKEAQDLLGEAKALVRKGDCDGAIKNYEQFLRENPKSADAYAGLAGCYLKKNSVAQASATVTKGLQASDLWPLRVALGELYFRQGHIPEAEKEWLTVINAGNQAARAYLGLARVRRAISMNKTAKAMIEKAHELDPADPDIWRFWMGTLPLSERINYFEKSLIGAHYSDVEELRDLESYLAYLKWKRTNQRDNPCRLVSNIQNTETPLVRLLLDRGHLRGYGLDVELNGNRSRLMLDTGASGITVKRPIAQRAGVTKLMETQLWGVGDKGKRKAYVGTVHSVRLGELEFQDCPVEVMEARSVAGEEGLIGADVFRDFLVDIDFLGEKLKLGKLPKRPGEADHTMALNNDDDWDKSEQPDQSQLASEAGGKEPAPTARPRGPQDRFIAPEMQSYTRVYRFGHHLLVPTKVDLGLSFGKPFLLHTEKLFLLDTGSINNVISPEAAREVTGVQLDASRRVKGISGEVKKVYDADKVAIQFGDVRQENQDMISFDLSKTSDDEGTEISGILGFVALRFLDIKLDYRDALVDFNYNISRLH